MAAPERNARPPQAGRDYAFLKPMPWRSRIAILSAVFFTFGSMGFLQHMWSIESQAPWLKVALVVLYNGLFAVGILMAVSLNRAWIPAVVILGVSFPLLISRLTPTHPPVTSPDLIALQQRLQSEGIACMVFIVAGYTLFIRFIRTEGTRQLRATTEIALAERIHSTLVPSIALEAHQLEVFGQSEPSSEVGGDLIDAVERDGHLIVCVADVSGHGVAAGSFMGMTKSAFRMRLLSPSSLGTLLDDVGEVVTQLRSPGMFVTFAGIRFDGSRTAEVALAGHLPVLHWRKASATTHAIENLSPPLGVVAGQRHTSQHVRFEPGDVFLIVTDGLTEVTDRRNEEFGLDGITRTLEAHVHAPLARLYSELLAAARAHGPQTDDQTLLLIRAQ